MKKIIFFIVLYFSFPFSYLLPQSLDEQLLEVVKSNNIEQVKSLVEQGANVNSFDKNGGTILMWAAYKSDLEMVKYLVEKGADYKKNIIYPFYVTDEWYFSSYLTIAVHTNNMQMLKYFVESCKIDINESGIDSKFINHGRTNYTALHCAVNNSLKDFVIFLLDNGADFNLHDLKENLTPLDLAIKSQNFKIAKIFRFYGQETSYYYDNLQEEVPDKYNYLSTDKKDAFELMDLGLDSLLKREILKNNSLVNLKNKDGETLLHKAEYFGNSDLIKFLLNNEAKIDEKDNYGYSPLLKSIQLSNLEIARLLIDKGADINIPNNSGITPFLLSKTRNYTELVDLFNKKGAVINYTQKLYPELQIQNGHAGEIQNISCSSDGKYLASCDYEKIILWECNSGKKLKEYYDVGIKNVLFSPDSKVIAYIAENYKKIKLIDIFSGELIKVIQNDYEGDLNGVIFLPDGKNIPRGDIYSFIYSPDGKYIASNCYLIKDGSLIQNSIMIWDILKCKVIRIIQSKVSDYTSYAFSKDGDMLIAGNSNGDIELVKTRFFEKSKIISGHSNSVIAVEFTNDNKSFISRSADSTFKKWDLNTFKEVRSIRLSPSLNFSCDIFLNKIYFSEDNKYILTKTEDYISYFDINSLEIEKKINITDFSKSELSDYIIYNNNLILAFKSRDSYIKKSSVIKSYDLDKEQINNNFEVTSNLLLPNSYSPLGNYIVLLENSYNLNLHNVLSNNNIKIKTPKDNYVISIKYSSDEHYLLCTFWDSQILKNIKKSTVLLYDVLLNKEIAVYELNGISCGADFSSDNKKIICGCKNEIKIWEVNEGKELKTITSDYSVTFATFTNAEKTIVSKVSQIGDLVDMQFFDYDSKKLIKSLKRHSSDDLLNMTFSSDGNHFIEYFFGKGFKLYKSRDGKEFEFSNFSEPIVYSFSNDNKYLLIRDKDSCNIKVYDFPNKSVVMELNINGTEYKREEKILSLKLSNDNKYISAILSGGRMKVWDFKSGKELFTFISLGSEDWVIITPDGRFDSSPNGMNLLHFSINTVAGIESIVLDQLKERYYEPGLISKLMGYNLEPIRDTKGINNIELFPYITLTSPNENNGKLGINLKNRGGGIGKVRVLINQKEIFSELPGPEESLDLPELNLTIPIKENKYLFLGEDNEIEVYAYNKEGYLSSRGVKLKYLPEGTMSNDKPEFYAIIVGVSDYEGTALDLRYASKDAEDIAGALKIGASSLFGQDKTHIRLLSNSSTDINNTPTKVNISKAFNEFSTARPQDVFLVYLSGHGVNLGSGTEKEDFYYLTKEARTGNLEDPAIKEQTSISSKELTELMLIVSANKQILILDVCGSGEVVKKLTDKRDIPSSQIRAFERMKDRAGLNILTGCAADAVSYEASRFAQGLLTYSLLMGMKGAALKDDGMIDVRKLFEFSADKVPELAKNIGGIQQPRIFGGASFDIGQIKNEDKTKIPLSVEKPLVLQSKFMDAVRFIDHLEMEKKVNEALLQFSCKGFDSKFVYIQVQEFPGAYSLAGQYIIKENFINVDVKLFKGIEEKKGFKVTGDINKIDELVKKIIEEAEKQF